MSALEKRTSSLIYVVIALTAAGVFMFDLAIPLGVAGGVPYIAVVLISLSAPRPRLTILAAAFGGTTLTILGYFFSSSDGIFWMVVSNRLLAIAAVWATAIFGLVHDTARVELWHASEMLESRVLQRTADLAQSNERLQAEVQERKETEQRFQKLVESAPDALVIVDSTGKNVLVNAQAEKLFGHTRADMLGQTVELLLPSRFRQQHIVQRNQFFARPSTRGMGVGLELTGLHADGMEFPVEVSLSQIDSTGQQLIACSIRDVTDRKKTQEALRALNNELGQRVARRTADLQQANSELKAFTYSVSHDLHAPLRAIRAFSEIIANRHRASLNDQGQHYFDNIVEASRHMERLISDLLAYSKIESRELSLHRVCLRDLVQRVAHDMPRAENRLDLTVSGMDDLPDVWGHKTLLQQIFGNLLTNAVTFHQKGIAPVVSLSWHDDDDFVVVSVRDNGIGIRPEFHEKVFNLFQRLHSNDEFPGTGVGLAIVDKAVRKLGGNVWVESTVGEGSTFFVKLKRNSLGA